MNAPKQIEDRYLGDGVYASFDGYQVWLDTRAQSPVNRIALEPSVLLELDQFRQAVEALRGPDEEAP
jgi:hypothetical protein